MSTDQYRAGFEAAMTKLGHPIRKDASGNYLGMNEYRFEGYVAAQRGTGATYRYPTVVDIQADVATESAAIATAVSAMSDSIEHCPLSNSLRVYAAIELAFRYGDRVYVEEVFSEVLHLGALNGRG
jgi:hypothetical protein